MNSAFPPPSPRSQTIVGSDESTDLDQEEEEEEKEEENDDGDGVAGGNNEDAGGDDETTSALDSFESLIHLKATLLFTIIFCYY